jgi:sugar/nucleoside kinase (ribokinase family)
MGTKKKYDVLVVGELNVDIILNGLNRLPELGKEILANRMAFTLGSSSAIFAANLSVLGASVAFVGTTGQDLFAETIFAELAAKNVDTSLIRRSGTLATGLSVALSYANDRYMITYPGAMDELTADDIGDEILQSASHLHISSVFLQKGLKGDIASLCARAKAAGLTTSLDPQWDPEERWDINLAETLPFVDLFLPNAEEFKRITGEQEIAQGLQKIAPFANTIVIKNGVHGATVWNKHKTITQAVFRNEHVVDAIGAGDSFNAGFISRFVSGKPFRECAEFGALTGAINTTAAGGTGAFSSFENVKTTAKQIFNYIIS